MQQKKLHINTIGCQMNVYDSERIANTIHHLGYRLTDSPRKADMIIVNTCAIREKQFRRCSATWEGLPYLRRSGRI
jgi:tRNA-2-methylthio-N6-dimethylallyladenosine synthase